MIDSKKQEDIKNFIQQLKLNGEFRGQSFIMLPWQKEFTDSIYGTVNEKGLRIYNYAYLEIPKKNGKTELIAAIAAYHLFRKDDEEIYCCAADREQASLIYKAVCGQIEQDDYLSGMNVRGNLKIYKSQKKIENKITRSTLTVLSAEAYTKHGINPTVVIFDEMHAQPNRELWDTMTFGSGAARKEPIFFIITTAGDDPDRKSIGWELHEKAKRIIDNEIVEPNWYCKIYGLEDGADIYDESNWYKANPSMGKTIDIETVRKEAISAKNNPSEEKLFKWLRLNMWLTVKSYGWMDKKYFHKNITKTLTLQNLEGKIGYEGVDLSSVNDLTATSIFYPKQLGLEKHTVIFKTFIPADNAKERIRRDKVKYAEWIAAGHIIPTEGDVVDYNYIKWSLRNDNEKYSITEFGADAWNAEKLIQDLELRTDLTPEEACRVKPLILTKVPQTIAMFCPTMKEIERLIKLGEIQFLNNPVAEWAFGNVRLVTDGNGNYKPDKKKSTERIDPIIAFINAFYLYMKSGASKRSIYEERGVIAI